MIKLSYNYNKNKLEGLLNNINSMYNKNESRDEINKYILDNDKNIKLDIIDGDKYSTIKLNKKYSFITPGLDKILKNEIHAERIVYNE